MKTANSPIHWFSMGAMFSDTDWRTCSTTNTKQSFLFSEGSHWGGKWNSTGGPCTPPSRNTALTNVNPLLHSMVNKSRSVPVIKKSCIDFMQWIRGPQCALHNLFYAAWKTAAMPSHYPLYIFLSTLSLCTTTLLNPFQSLSFFLYFFPIFCCPIFPYTAMYQPLYLCKSTGCENEACLMSWTLQDFMPFLPGNGRIMKM